MSTELVNLSAIGALATVGGLDEEILSGRAGHLVIVTGSAHVDGVTVQNV